MNIDELRRGIRTPTVPEKYVFTRLGGIAWAGLATTIYASIGVVVLSAGGLAPVAMLIVGLFIALTALTYTELTGLRGPTGARLVMAPGASGFARLGFNEVVSFVAGWAVVLDLLLLTAIAAESAAAYATAIVGATGSAGTWTTVIGVGVIIGIAVRNARGPNLAKGVGIRVLLALDALVLAVLAVLLLEQALADGLPLVQATDGVGVADVLFAATIGVIAVTGFETAATLAGETPVPRERRKRFLAGLTIGTLITLVLGGALAGAYRTELTGEHETIAPVWALAGAIGDGWGTSALQAVAAVLATTTLVVAGNGAMLAVARLSSSMATARQIPARVGRLSPRFGTPTIVIVLVVLCTSLLVIALNMEQLIGLYAFGALLAIIIVNLSLLRARFTLPDADRRYAVPWSIKVGAGTVPLPTVLGLLLAVGGWIAVITLHERSALVGGLWMLGGVALYVANRRISGLPLRKTVAVPKTVLSRDIAHGEFGSILVPVFGRALDDDIVQSAGRLARDKTLDVEDSGGAQIEAIWVFEIPMSLPLDASVSDERLAVARAALKRAKAVGEEYEGITVATATIRARRAGQAIVDEAKRRGVDVILMAAEEPSRVRGGSTLGGVGDFSGRSLGPITTYVLGNAPCRVLLTAPPLGDRAVGESKDPVADPADEGRGPVKS